MSDNGRSASEFEQMEIMRRAAAEVMAIQDVTIGRLDAPLRIRGQLVVSAEEAFRRLRPQFEAVGYTPTLRREEGMDVIRALPHVFGTEQQRIPWLAIILLVATIVSVFFVGVSGELYVPFGVAFEYRLSGQAPPGIPADVLPSADEFSKAIQTGLLYTAALLGILGAHEMGHYLVARYHKVHTTLPFFIPMPFNILGTLGAVIAIREPSPNRRVQFDIGVAGPLAGLILAVPVMIVGLSLSDVLTAEQMRQTIPVSVRDNVAFFQEGQSLLYLALKYLVFGKVLPQGGLDVFIHPVAFAAWAGFLVTALNLIPIGQLDGGHILYGLLGKRMEQVRRPVIAALVVMAVMGTIRETALTLPVAVTATWWGQTLRSVASLPIPGWSGWWIWIMMIVFLLRNHAPVLDEITELDTKRRALGIAMLVIFILIFTPTPLAIIPTS